MAITKRILSVVLTVVMILSVVQIGVSAVDISAGETITANQAMVDDGTGREVIPQATVTATPVVRVAAAAGSMAQGSTIVAATPSGVPQITSTYATEAYSGETPSAAQITFTTDLSLANNKNVTIQCTNNTTITFAATNPNSSTWVWTITGGTAAAGTYLDFEIGYSYTYTDRLTGKTVTNSYVAYASSYVEGIIQPAGMYVDHARSVSWHSDAEADFAYRILGQGTYGSYYDLGDGSGGSGDNHDSGGSWAHGYYDFVSMSAQGWGWDANEAAGYGMVFNADKGSNANRYCNTSVDRQRPVSTTYIDSSKGTALNSPSINLRYAAMDTKTGYKLNEYERSVNGTETRVLPGEVTFDGNTIDNSTASNQVAFAAQNETVVLRQDNGVIPANQYRVSDFAVSIPFNGTTYKDAMETLSDGTKEIYYTFISALYGEYYYSNSPSASWLTMHTAVHLHFIMYNKGELRGLVEDALDYYTPVSPLGTEMGIMPQARYYSTGWNEFKSALTNAQRVLAKPNLYQADIDNAYAALDTAMDGLVLAKADYTAVDNAVATLAGKNADHYTPESWNAVVAARNAVINNYSKFYQLAVDKMATDLLAAIDALKLRDADFALVDEAIEATKGVNRSLYTAESLKVMDDLVTEAQSATFRAKPATEQDIINEMADKIYDAIEKLGYKLADYSSVDTAVKRYLAIDRSLYTDASYERVTAYYESIVYGLNITQQPLVEEMAADLNRAIDNYLVYLTADYDAVNDALDKYDSLNPSAYTPSSWAVLEDAVDAVVEGLPITRQDEVNAMAAAIEDAISKLQFALGNYSKVTEAITKADNLDKSIYTPESWAELEAAIDDVEYGLSSEFQSTIDGFAAAIEAAIKDLQYVGANYDAVDAAIGKWEAVDTSLYTAASILRVRTAVNNVDRTKTIDEQAEVDAMAQAIEDALTKLELKAANYAAVDAALATAQNIVDAATAFANANNGHSYYTSSSYRQLTRATGSVIRGYLIDKQADVDAMALAINSAIAGLENNVANYTAVNAAKAKYNAVNKALYTDSSVMNLELAVLSVEEGLLTDEQDYVNSFATAIEAAIAALVYKPIDTAEYNAVKATIPTDLSGYTDDSVKAVTDADAAIVSFLAGDVNISHQASLDALVDALADAISKLEVKVTAYFRANADSTCVISGGYITGLQVRLTAAVLKNTYLDFEGVTVDAVNPAGGRFLGTGSVVTVEYPDGTVEEYIIIIYGDMNGDGTITTTDLADFDSTFVTGEALTEPQKKAMNVDGSRRVDLADLSIVESVITSGGTFNQVDPTL